MTLRTRLTERLGIRHPILLAPMGFAAGNRRVGIADGRGLAAALMLGAAGALIGTRFYASVESLAHEKDKARLAAASGEGAARISDDSRHDERHGRTRRRPISRTCRSGAARSSRCSASAPLGGAKAASAARSSSASPRWRSSPGSVRRCCGGRWRCW